MKKIIFRPKYKWVFIQKEVGNDEVTDNICFYVQPSRSLARWKAKTFGGKVIKCSSITYTVEN